MGGKFGMRGTALKIAIFFIVGMYFISMKKNFINHIICGDALKEMSQIPSSSISLIITSPPYWNLVDYQIDGQYGQCSYNEYLDQMVDVFKESSRVLEPNGKIAWITPIVPLSKSVDDSTHTRKLLNISADTEQRVLKANLDLHRFSLYIWQKQTTKKMFGSYPFPPNIYEDNTIEFINVFVKDGAPKKLSKEVKERSKMSQNEWLNFSMQVWPIMPTNIQRKNGGGHPAPFPLEIPRRLISMYTFKAAPQLGFKGDIVLDMFNGSGSTCIAACEMQRRFIGIELNIDYCKLAEKRIREVSLDIKPNLIIDKIHMPSKNTIQLNSIPQGQLSLFQP